MTGVDSPAAKRREEKKDATKEVPAFLAEFQTKKRHAPGPK